jgi:hypothetical protein
MLAGSPADHCAGSLSSSGSRPEVSRVAAAGAMALTRTPYRCSSALAMMENVAMPVLAAP